MVQTSRFATAPLDIIDEIMSACHDLHIDRTTGSVQGVDEVSDLFTRAGMTWMASYVCQHWRQAILSIPSAWSQIIILDEQMTKGRAGLNKLLSLMLERSKVTPLTVYIHCCDAWDGAYSQQVLDETLRILSVHLYRIQQLSFTLDASSTSLTSLASSAPSSLPMLRWLQPCLINIGHPYIPPETVTLLFSNAPCLDMVTLSYRDCMDIFELPWSQIRYITSPTSSTNVPDIIRILSLMPNLIKVHTGLIYSQQNRPLPEITHIPLRSLVSLTISFGDKVALEKVIPLLDFPSLTELNFHGLFSVDPVKNLITRSRCGPQLVKLQLICFEKYTNTPADDILSILELTPNVEELLVLPLKDSDGDILLSFFLSKNDISSPTGGSPSPFPKLSKLELRINNSSNGSIDSFLSDVPLRCPSLVFVDVYDVTRSYRKYEYRR